MIHPDLLEIIGIEPVCPLCKTTLEQSLNLMYFVCQNRSCYSKFHLRIFNFNEIFDTIQMYVNFPMPNVNSIMIENNYSIKLSTIVPSFKKNPGFEMNKITVPIIKLNPETFVNKIKTYLVFS